MILERNSLEDVSYQQLIPSGNFYTDIYDRTHYFEMIPQNCVRKSIAV